METIQRFGLGAVASPEESDSPATSRIAIPYLSPTGPVNLRFRRMPGDDRMGKYWQPAGTKLGLFNTWEITQPRSWIAIAEGEIDAMTATQCGIPCVGLPGVASWKDHYRPIFDGYDRVLILADNDDKAGQGAGFAEKVAELVPAPAVFLMPDGHDVNSFYIEAGRDALRKHLKLS